MSTAGFMVEVLATYHHSASTREHKRSFLPRGARIALERSKSATAGGECPASADCVEDRTPFRCSPLGEHVFDPCPACARGANVGLALEAALQTVEPGTNDIDARERRAVERRVAFGAERSDAEGDRDAFGELGGQGD